MTQSTFASLAFERKRFLGNMEAGAPWAALLAGIEPHYPKTSRCCRPSMPLETMQPHYFGQQSCALSDPAVEGVVDSGTGRIAASRDQAPPWLRKGALQGDREERRAGVFTDRTSQPLSGEARIDGLTSEIRPPRPR